MMAEESGSWTAAYGAAVSSVRREALSPIHWDCTVQRSSNCASWFEVLQRVNQAELE